MNRLTHAAGVCLWAALVFSSCAYVPFSSDVHKINLSRSVTTLACGARELEGQGELLREIPAKEPKDSKGGTAGSGLIGNFIFKDANCFTAVNAILVNAGDRAKVRLVYAKQAPQPNTYVFHNGPKWDIGSIVDIYIEMKGRAALSSRYLWKLGSAEILRKDDTTAEPDTKPKPIATEPSATPSTSAITPPTSAQ